MTKSVTVAMSGGVDSSAAAILLLEQGWDVRGATMRHFDSKAMGFADGEGLEADIERAREVCRILGIPYRVIDVQQEFSREIIDYFVKEYRCGNTPNPCTRCNPLIKWGAFLDRLDTGFMATGHYVTVEEQDGLFRVFRAEDRNRDQTYMLWGLTQRMLARTLFPLDHLPKSRVREIAKEHDLPIHDSPDSQENCFIPGDYRVFLRKYFDEKPGDIVLHDGTKIGEHKGLSFYTIGQRRGMELPWSAPLFVQEIDAANNRLIVTDDPKRLETTRFRIDRVNWLDGAMPDIDDIGVQIRYNSKPVAVKGIADGVVTLEEPVRAITPGQSAVFYHRARLLGGGIIGRIS